MASRRVARGVEVIRHRAPARAGLLGNPSDGYGGRCIGLPVWNFAASVTCTPSRRLRFVPGPRDEPEYAGLDAFAEQVDRHGYYGGLRLLKATVKRFRDRCVAAGVELEPRNFTLAYETDVPERVGLAGSSAIVTAALRALLDFHGVTVPLRELPTLVLEAETRELGIPAGLMDRVVQVYEDVVYMDLDRELVEARGFGRYEPLDAAGLPPLFVAYREDLAEGSEVTHDDLSRRFRRGDADVLGAVEELSALADEGRDLLQAGRGAELGPLVDRNFDLRASICRISEGNRELVETGRRAGAHVKFAGSGGAVLGVYDGDPARLERLEEAYAAIGGRVVIPRPRRPSGDAPREGGGDRRPGRR